MSNIEQTTVDAAISNGATASAPEVANEPLINAEAQPASVSSDFLSSLSEELKGHKALQNFKSAEDLAKSYLNANQLLGKRMNELSAEDANYFKGLIGVPESADKYKLPEEMNADMAGWYKGLAHKAGLTQDQAKSVIDEYIMLERSQVERQKVEMDRVAGEWVEGLKKEFGSAFEKQIEVAKRGVQAFGGDDIQQLLNETGLGNHPAVVKMFAKIGKELLEDSIVHADKEAVFGITPDNAKVMIEQKMGDAEFKKAYFNGMHPGHKSAVAELSRLYELMNAR